MGIVSIAALRPGMELASDILDSNGRKIISEGTIMSDKHLRILKIWGVTEADVKGVDQEEENQKDLSQIDPQLVEATREYLLARFVYDDVTLRPVKEMLSFLLLRKARELESRGYTAEEVKIIKPPPPPGELIPLPVKPLNLTVAELMRDDVKLGSLPMVFHKLVDVVNDSRSSATDVAEIISNDMDLAARVLKVVNSPFYGLSVPIDSVSRAVAILGSNQLVSLAMGISVVTHFRGISSQHISMEGFWKHSIAVGIGARLLGSYHKTPNTERFFVAGLLHDVGRLMMYKHLPGPMHDALDRADQSCCLLLDAEKEILGFSHPELGAALLKEWRLPVSLERNVAGHHDIDKAANQQEAAIMLTADWLAHGMELGTSGERYMPRYPAAAWDVLDIPLSCLSETAKQMQYQVEQVLRFFLSDV
ncbi:HDOD domain-containing protein [Oceanidesulfovibrio indonesiensis]|uniref:HDOD domain-containing protein n=1 Tax=Oceanidesulfovibrio indonesiensis TaxID=54767 RepID=A0A7M3MB97_9BACT|nr:HDOD domain-containing protein [Oceanidesulfovibrio indonesiensis]TVM15389.1 HDOD domain-containing protein [Oceanidesulfovibrio indonesiensis]